MTLCSLGSERVRFQLERLVPSRFSGPTGERRLATAEFRRQELIILGGGALLARKVLLDGNHNVLWDEIYLGFYEKRRL